MGFAQGFLRTVAAVVFFGVFVFAALNDDSPISALAFLVIVFGALAISRFGRPTKKGGLDGATRQSVSVPGYVSDLMSFRWLVLIGGGLLAGLFDSMVLWGVAIACFIGVFEYVSRRYHRENPVDWEIAFHNETDGYSNEGDGDGDGD